MKKNKTTMIWFFLGILIVLLIVLFFLNKEGMATECAYQYLSPNQTNTPLDDKTIEEFLTLYNSQMDQIGSKFKLNRDIYNKWTELKVWCSEETQYYLKNKYFPINDYLLYELKANKKITFPAPFNRSTIAFVFSARMIYYQLVVPAYAGDANLPPRVKEAQAIYTGEKPEQACSSGDTAAPNTDPAVSDVVADPAGPV
jgi:hypothetical protein